MTELGRAYGGALYALAEDEQLENELLAQMDAVCKLLVDNPDYVRLIKDKAIAKNSLKKMTAAGTQQDRGPDQPYFQSLLYSDYGYLVAEGKRSRQRLCYRRSQIR